MEVERGLGMKGLEETLTFLRLKIEAPSVSTAPLYLSLPSLPEACSQVYPHQTLHYVLKNVNLRINLQWKLLARNVNEHNSIFVAARRHLLTRERERDKQTRSLERPALSNRVLMEGDFPLVSLALLLSETVSPKSTT